MSLIYYDDIALGELTSLVNCENNTMRTSADYHTSSTFYANEVLEYTDNAAIADENEKYL